MLITVIVANQLGSGLHAREQSLRRDAALANTGSRLLGVLEVAEIRVAAWVAAVEICAATPGLRLLRVVRSGEVLRVEGGTGGFDTVPATLPGRVITVGEHSDQAWVADKAPLDEAVGVPLEWVCLSVAEEFDHVWLLVGAARRIPADAMLTVRSLMNQTKLAQRNCTVHLELLAQARIDSLTGLANRAAFTAGLAAHIAHRAKTGEAHVLFVDLDDFKDVNDLLGHLAGDELLIEVSARMRTYIRPNDLCARLGGDEFAVMLLDRSAAEADGIARRILDGIAQPIYLGGRTARVGASIGIASSTPGIDVDELVHRADVAIRSKSRREGPGADLRSAFVASRRQTGHFRTRAVAGRVRR